MKRKLTRIGVYFLAHSVLFVVAYYSFFTLGAAEEGLGDSSSCWGSEGTRYCRRTGEGLGVLFQIGVIVFAAIWPIITGTKQAFSIVEVEGDPYESPFDYLEDTSFREIVDALTQRPLIIALAPCLVMLFYSSYFLVSITFSAIGIWPEINICSWLPIVAECEKTT